MKIGSVAINPGVGMTVTNLSILGTYSYLQNLDSAMFATKRMADLQSWNVGGELKGAGMSVLNARIDDFDNEDQNIYNYCINVNGYKVHAFNCYDTDIVASRRLDLLVRISQKLPSVFQLIEITPRFNYLELDRDPKSDMEAAKLADMCDLIFVYVNIAYNTKERLEVVHRFLDKVAKDKHILYIVPKLPSKVTVSQIAKMYDLPIKDIYTFPYIDGVTKTLVLNQELQSLIKGIVLEDQNYFGMARSALAVLKRVFNPDTGSSVKWINEDKLRGKVKK